MSRISRTLTTIYRTDVLIRQRQLSVVQHQAVLIGLAGLALLTALIAMNVALYLMMAALLSPAGAAGIIAFGNFCLAALLALTAKRLSAEQEIAPAVEVRDMAIADLELEIENATKEVRDVVDTLKGVKSDPLSSILTLLVPILTSVSHKKDK